MTQEFRVDGVLLTNAVRLDGVTGLPSAAWYGEAPTAGLEIDDPDGSLDLRGWHTFTHDETACSKPRTFSGWLTGRRISRGPYRTGAGRVWECDVIDLNALFSFEVFRASSAKRPEEFDIDRVAWAIASAPMAGTPVHDNGLFNTTDNPINFGPADYVTQVPGELFASVAAVSGKNFYAYWDDVAEEVSIFYDLVGSNPAAGIAISNVLADVDDEFYFYPYRDAVLDRSPERIATGILFGYQGGNYVYARDENLIGPSEFSPTNWRRDEVYRTDRVGLQATAEALAAQMLADRAVEWDTVRVTVRLPASKVNLVAAGDLVTVRFTHLDGYDPETPLPVIRRNVVPSPGRRDSYDVTLELSLATSNRGPGGGDPGDGPYEGDETCSDDQFIGATGTGLYAFPDAWFDEDDDTIDWVTGGAIGGWAMPEVVTVSRIRILWSYGDIGSGAAAAFEIATNTALSATGWTAVLTDTDPVTHAGASYPGDFELTYDLDPPVSSAYWRFKSTAVGNNDIRTLQGFSCTDVPPGAMQVVRNELVWTGDGTTTSGTTRFPYVPGSLRVFVDGVQVINGLTETDPEAGEFELDFAPKAATGDTRAELVTATYQAGVGGTGT